MLEQPVNPSGGIREVRDVELRRRLGAWSTQLGIAQIILGIVALSTMNDPSLAAVMRFGWLVVVSGIVEAIHAFHLRRSDAFFLHLVPAIAGVPIGVLIATHPEAGTVAWMLLFASFFTVVGLFRIIAAFRLKFSNWPWAALEGVITLILGTLLWTAWPWLGSWFFGVAVGISLLLRGWSSIMFAVGLRSSHTPTRTSMSTAWTEGKINLNAK